MSKWQINPLSKNKVEVTARQVRYVVQADATSMRVQTYRGKQRIETFYARHVGHNYRIEGTDGKGRVERRDTYVTEKRVVTRGTMGGKRFKIDASACEYLPLLITLIKRRKRIKLPHTLAFTKLLRGDPGFRRQLRRHVHVARLMSQPDAVIIACIYWCVSCFFTGDPLDCVLCDLCLETPPKGPVIIA